MMPVLADFLGRCIVCVENGNLDIEGSCGFAQHSAQLATAEKANNGIGTHFRFQRKCRLRYPSSRE